MGLMQHRTLLSTTPSHSGRNSAKEGGPSNMMVAGNLSLLISPLVQFSIHISVINLFASSYQSMATPNSRKIMASNRYTGFLLPYSRKTTSLLCSPATGSADGYLVSTDSCFSTDTKGASNWVYMTGFVSAFLLEHWQLFPEQQPALEHWHWCSFCPCS